MSNQDETANAVTRPVKKNPAKIIITIFVSLVVFAAVFILSAYFYTKAHIKPLYASSQAASEEQVEKTKIEISMGTSVFKISEILEKNYIIRDSRFFYLFIHKPQHKLGKVLNDKAYLMTDNIDLILFMVDISRGFGKGDRFVLDRIKDTNTKIILLLNKVDAISKEELIKRIN